jgi:hypothetical protein
MNLAKNPLIKIVGILIIIYFALFYDTQNKSNLRNRLSTDKLKKNFVHIKNTTENIKKNIKTSRVEFKSGVDQSGRTKYNTYEDVNQGSGIEVKCGDGVTISFTKSSDDMSLTQRGYTMQVDNSELSKNIIGMKVGGTKKFKLKEEVNGKISSYIYKVELIKITTKENEKNDKKCD